jgi:hypothetical protein
MPKIVDPDQLIIGTNLTVDTTARTVTLSVGGSLIAKDGYAKQALYSKLVELWTLAAYNKFPFPMYASAVRSGEYLWGTDGRTFNGWRLGDDLSRNMSRDAGWSEFSSGGALQRQYVGIVTLGDLNSGVQPYYQRVSGGPAVNFTYLDETNAAVQVFGDASNGNFDTRTFFRVFAREYQYTYVDSSLADAAELSTGPYVIKFGLSNAFDAKITAPDSSMSSAPYNSITVTYYNTDQTRIIGGTAYPFRIIIDGASATAEQIYTKIQYLLRQDADIDSGAGTVNGKTADKLLSFVGDNITTSLGVYVDRFNTSDINRITFTDRSGTARKFPFTSAGVITFNEPLIGEGSTYRVWFKSLPGSGNDYGEDNAVTVNDASGTPLAGTVSSGSIPFTYDYDGNVQGGRTAGTDATVVVVAVKPGSGKVSVAEATIGRAVGQTIALVAETERAYSNP